MIESPHPIGRVERLSRPIRQQGRYCSLMHRFAGEIGCANDCGIDLTPPQRAASQIECGETRDFFREYSNAEATKVVFAADSVGDGIAKTTDHSGGA